MKMKNFRDKWVGSSEGNLEKIFRLIHALGRCYVFIDEADQSLVAEMSQVAIPASAGEFIPCWLRKWEAVQTGAA